MMGSRKFPIQALYCTVIAHTAHCTASPSLYPKYNMLYTIEPFYSAGFILTPNSQLGSIIGARGPNAAKNYLQL